MTQIVTPLLEHAAAGLRMALTLFALMLLLDRGRRLSIDPDPRTWFQRIAETHQRVTRLESKAWTLMAIAVICFSPLRSAGLLGARTPLPFSVLGDVLASGLACAAFILRIAKRGHLEGLTPARIHRGIVTNAAIMLLMVAATWISR